MEDTPKEFVEIEYIYNGRSIPDIIDNAAENIFCGHIKHGTRQRTTTLDTNYRME